MSEPTTAAGRALGIRMSGNPDGWLPDVIVAIENEAAAAARAERDRLRTMATRYQAAVWALRLNEDEDTLVPEHNARIDEWEAADQELRDALKGT